MPVTTFADRMKLRADNQILFDVIADAHDLPKGTARDVNHDRISVIGASLDDLATWHGIYQGRISRQTVGTEFTAWTLHTHITTSRGRRLDLQISALAFADDSHADLADAA